jgi:hypothetical protein
MVCPTMLGDTPFFLFALMYLLLASYLYYYVIFGLDFILFKDR